MIRKRTQNRGHAPTPSPKPPAHARARGRRPSLLAPAAAAPTPARRNCDTPPPPPAAPAPRRPPVPVSGFVPGITTLLVVALAAHSHAAWEGCSVSFASDDCSGDAITNDPTSACAQINAGCEEDIDNSTTPYTSTWSKLVSTSAICMDGAVIDSVRDFATAALCEAGAATDDGASTIGLCKVHNTTTPHGANSQNFLCGAVAAGSASVAASAMVVLLAAVASQTF